MSGSMNVKFEVSEPIFEVFEAEYLKFPVSTFYPLVPVAGGCSKTYEDNSMYTKEVEGAQTPRWK